MLKGSKVAILCADEDGSVELEAAKKTLTDAGAEPVLIPSELPLEDAHTADYSALVLLGTCATPDSHDADPVAVQFVREFMSSDKPVGAIGNGARLLIAADAVAGRTLTSSLELAGDVHRAGGDWVDRPVEVDDALVTSRSAADLPVFTDRIVREFSLLLDDRKADQLSEQSFPASDPPPGPSSIGGKGAAKDSHLDASP